MKLKFDSRTETATVALAIEGFRESLSLDELRVMKALGYPLNFGGIVTALGNAIRRLDKVEGQDPLERTSDWAGVVRGLHKRAHILSLTIPMLSTTTAGSKDSETFRTFLNPVACSLPQNVIERLDRLLGLYFLEAVATNTTVASQCCTDWQTLRRLGLERKGMDPAWKSLIEDFPVTEFQIVNAGEAANLPPRISELLASMRRALKVELPAVNSLGGTANPSFTEVYALSNDDDDFEDCTDDPQVIGTAGESSPRNDEPRKKNTLIPWIIKSCEKRGYLDRFGISGVWHQLPPQDLAEICRNVLRKFDTCGDREQGFACFAICSVKTGLSPRIALTIPLVPNGDIWLDALKGEVVWNATRLTKQQSDTALMIPNYIRLAVDRRVAEYLKLQQAKHPSARTLSELLGVIGTADEITHWLKSYRKFLRLQAGEVHGAYAARFSSSQGQAVRFVTGSDVLAAFVALDFTTIPPGMLHYITLNARFLRAKQREVDKYLGFETDDSQIEEFDEVVGSENGISRHEFCQGWRLLQSQALATAEKVSSATSVGELVESWNVLIRTRLLSFVTVTANRASRLARLTFEALLTHPEYFLFGDKDTDRYKAYRIVPNTPLASSILAALQADLKMLEEKASELKSPLLLNGADCIAELSPQSSAFFEMKIVSRGARIRLKRVIIQPGSLDLISKELFHRPRNIGRHFLISELAILGAPLWTICSLTGHGRQGVEVFSDSMSVSPKRALAAVKQALQAIFDELALAPVPTGATPHLAKNYRLTALKSPSVKSDPYLNPSRGEDGRILPAPADRLTLTSVLVVNQVRGILTKEMFDGEAGAEWAISAATFDGIHPWDLKNICARWTGSFGRIGKSTCAAWTRERCGNEIIVPLTAPTVVALSNADLTMTPDFMRVAASSGAWLRKHITVVQWPADDADAFLVYGSFVSRWLRFHISPCILAAASRAIPAATLNRESLLRMVSPEIVVANAGELFGFRPIKHEGYRTRAFRRETIAAVGGCLNVVGDTKKKLGEEERRAVILIKRLDMIDTKGDKPAECAVQVLREEARLHIETHSDGREFSSLHTYWSEVADALELLDVTDDVSKWTDCDFEEWAMLSMAKMRSKAATPDAAEAMKFFGFRRFLRTAKALGWAIPERLFTERGVASYDGMRKSAAASAVLTKDFVAVRTVVQQQLKEWPLLRQRAEIFIDLLEYAPLRAGELDTLPVKCVTRASKKLAVRTQGYSNTKSSNSVRLTTLPASIADVLLMTQSEMITSTGNALFISSNCDNWDIQRTVERVVMDAMTLVSRDPSIRRHSCRASAACRLAWPDWEKMAVSMFGCKHGAKFCRGDILLDYTHCMRSVLETGHGHISTFLIYYASIWPMILCHELRCELSLLTPSTSYLKGCLGSSEPYRSAHARAGEEFDAWDYLGGARSAHMKLPVFERRQPLPLVIPGSSGKLEKKDIATLTLSGLARFAGRTQLDASHRFGIAESLSTQLETAISDQGINISDLHKRRGGKAKPGGLKADLSMSESSLAQEIVNHLVEIPAVTLKLMAEDLDVRRKYVGKLDLTPAQLQDRLGIHATALPDSVFLYVRFSSKYPVPLDMNAMNTLRPRVVFGPLDKNLGHYPLIQVGLMSSPGSRVSTGRVTVLVRAAISAAIAAKGVAI